MKNVIIIILALVVGGLGFLYFTKDTSTKINNDTTTPQSTSAAETSMPTSAGKTLDLSNKGLTVISRDILDDSSVTTLDVSNNNLTGSLPAEIRKLNNLTVLLAANNKMTGIPAEIGQLSKLQTVNFANNNISGLPQEIGNLKNLVTLDLRGNPKVSNYDISLIKSKIPNAKILTD